MCHFIPDITERVLLQTSVTLEAILMHPNDEPFYEREKFSLLIELLNQVAQVEMGMHGLSADGESCRTSMPYEAIKNMTQRNKHMPKRYSVTSLSYC